MTERIRLSRQKGYRKPPGAILVSRPSKWGNPFGFRTHTGLARVPAAIGDGEWEYEGRISADGARHDYFHGDGRITVCHVRYMTRAEIVETYREVLLGDLTPALRMSCGRCLKVTVDDVRRELAGRDLACWCPLVDSDGTPVPCHADVLLEIANAPVAVMA